jgi:uncharacterized membrane protein YczE
MIHLLDKEVEVEMVLMIHLVDKVMISMIHLVFKEVEVEILLVMVAVAVALEVALAEAAWALDHLVENIKTSFNNNFCNKYRNI